MADEIDRAQRHEEMFTELASKVRMPEGPKATGKCLFCDEPVQEGHRWCDDECRDDWQKLNK